MYTKIKILIFVTIMLFQNLSCNHFSHLKSESIIDQIQKEFKKKYPYKKNYKFNHTYKKNTPLIIKNAFQFFGIQDSIIKNLILINEILLSEGEKQIGHIVLNDSLTLYYRSENKAPYSIETSVYKKSKTIEFIKNAMYNHQFLKFENYADSFRLNVKSSDATILIVSLYNKDSGLIYQKSVSGFGIL